MRPVNGRNRNGHAVLSHRRTALHDDVSARIDDFVGQKLYEFFVMVCPSSLNGIAGSFVKAVGRKAGNRQNVMHRLMFRHRNFPFIIKKTISMFEQ